MAPVIISQVLTVLFAVVLLAILGFEPDVFSAAVVISSMLAVGVVWWFIRDREAKR